MSGIVLPTNNKVPLNGLPRACDCGCDTVIYTAPYYWKVNNGKRRYYIVSHAIRLAIINTEDVPKLILRNKKRVQQIRDSRTHTVATKLGGNRIY